MNNPEGSTSHKHKKNLKVVCTILYFGLAIGIFFLITFNYTVKLCLF